MKLWPAAKRVTSRVFRSDLHVEFDARFGVASQEVLESARFVRLIGGAGNSRRILLLYVYERRPRLIPRTSPGTVRCPTPESSRMMGSLREMRAIR